MNRRPLIPALILAGSCLAQDEADKPLRVLIDRNLDRQLIELVSIDGAQINYIDAVGKSVSAPTDQFVAIAPIDPWDTAAQSASLFSRGSMISRPGILELTDGQRFVGTASVAEAGEEMLAWNYSRLGLISLPLESVRRIVLPRIMNTDQARPPLEVEADDLVRLTNGDTLRGFVATYGSTTSIELNDGSTIDTPITVLDEITLANPQLLPTGTRLWLTGGNIIDVQKLEPAAKANKVGSMTVTLDAGTITQLGSSSAASEADDAEVGPHFEIDRNLIEAINFDTQSLIPLASLDARAIERALTIDTHSTAALGAVDIHMPGPMSATWILPRGSTRLAFTAELPLESRAWGNLDLIVLIDGAERQRHTLSAESPEAHIRLDTENARELTITLDEGAFGPVQDRARLREAVVLIGR